MGPGHVDQHGDRSLGRAVSATLSTVTGTGRARASQACRASRPVNAEHGLAAVRRLQHDHGHLGLLVGGQPADGGARPASPSPPPAPATGQRTTRRRPAGSRRARDAARVRPPPGSASPGNGERRDPSSPGKRATGPGVRSWQRGPTRSRARRVPRAEHGVRGWLSPSPHSAPRGRLDGCPLGRRAPPPLHRSRPDRGDRGRRRVAQGQPRPGGPGHRSRPGPDRPLLHRPAPAGLGRGGGPGELGHLDHLLPVDVVRDLAAGSVRGALGGRWARRSAARLRPARPGTKAVGTGSSASGRAPPRARPAEGAGQGKAPAQEVDPEMAEIEAILKNRGIN